MLWRRPGHPAIDTAAQGDGVHLSLAELLGLRADAARLLAAPTRLSAGHLHGQQSSRFRGRGMDFDEVRPYQEGDDVRAIDWRVTARTGRAHTKLYREERERPVHLVLDQSDSLYFGSRNALKAVTAARAAALLTWAALAADQRIGALLFGSHDHVELKPSSSRRAIMSLLRTVSERHNAGLPFVQAARSLRRESVALAALRRLRHVMRPGSLVFVLSDFHAFDEAARLELAEIARHADVHAFIIDDPLERELPPDGVYGFCDGEAVIQLDTGDTRLRQRYIEDWRQHRAALRHYFLSQRITSTELGTELPLLDTLAEALMRGRRAA